MNQADLSAVASAVTRSVGPARPGADPARRARNDTVVRVGAMSTLWLSLLLVTYWWVRPDRRGLLVWRDGTRELFGTDGGQAQRT